MAEIVFGQGPKFSTSSTGRSGGMEPNRMAMTGELVLPVALQVTVQVTVVLTGIGLGSIRKICDVAACLLDEYCCKLKAEDCAPPTTMVSSTVGGRGEGAIGDGVGILVGAGVVLVGFAVKPGAVQVTLALATTVASPLTMT